MTFGSGGRRSIQLSYAREYWWLGKVSELLVAVNEVIAASTWYALISVLVPAASLGLVRDDTRVACANEPQSGCIGAHSNGRGDWI